MRDLDDDAGEYESDKRTIWEGLFPGFADRAREIRRATHVCGDECRRLTYGGLSGTRYNCCCTTYPCPMHAGSWKATTPA